jgi:enoyl-[acyl-carrier protein] reductase/trans-2-enoyl-CoA reductase (NAD+)
MIIQPKIKGFICTTAHPVGCEANVAEQIAFVKKQPSIPSAPKRVLVIGASTGYGLASRITAAFGGGVPEPSRFKWERTCGSYRIAATGCLSFRLPDTGNGAGN